MARVLIDNMASIKETDNDGNTSLHLAVLNRSTEVAELLVGCDACPDVFNAYAKTPLMLACTHSTWKTVKLLSRKSERNMMTGYLEQTPLDYMLSFQANSQNCNPDVRIFNLLLNRGSDFHQANVFGRSATHHLLSNHSRVHLRSILSTDASLLVNQKTQWSRSHFSDYSQPSSKLIAATRNFRLLRHYLSENDLRQTSDLAKVGKHNLFCAAACWGAVEAIQNLLAIGADLEHQCHEHGTAVMAAASFRKLETVKWLVRKGANITAQENGYGIGGIAAANCGWSIMHWLLVLRHIEQPKLASNSPVEGDREIVNWSGVTTIEAPIKWEWRKRRGETMLEYAQRRQAIVLKLRGRVLFVN